MCFEVNYFGVAIWKFSAYPLDGTHFDAVRGFSPKYINGKSSSGQRYFVRQELTDLLLYADAKVEEIRFE